MTQEELTNFRERMDAAQIAGDETLFKLVRAQYEARRDECQIHTGQRVKDMERKLDALKRIGVGILIAAVVASAREIPWSAVLSLLTS